MKKSERKPVEEPQLPPYLDEREQQMSDDYEWCVNDPEIRQKYAGKVVVVQGRKIWGVGKNHVAAWAAAQRRRGCPSRQEVALVPIP